MKAFSLGLADGRLVFQRFEDSCGVERVLVKYFKNKKFEDVGDITIKQARQLAKWMVRK